MKYSAKLKWLFVVIEDKFFRDSILTYFQVNETYTAVGKYVLTR